MVKYLSFFLKPLQGLLIKPYPDIFEVAVQANLLVSYPLLHNEFSFAKNFLSEGAFDTDFGNRKHDWMQERGRIKANQFLRF